MSCSDESHEWVVPMTFSVEVHAESAELAMEIASENAANGMYDGEAAFAEAGGANPLYPEDEEEQA